MSAIEKPPAALQVGHQDSIHRWRPVASRRPAFEELSYTNQKRHVLSIEGAKTSQTRQRRLAKAIDELRAAS